MDDEGLLCPDDYYRMVCGITTALYGHGPSPVDDYGGVRFEARFVRMEEFSTEPGTAQGPDVSEESSEVPSTGSSMIFYCFTHRQISRGRGWPSHFIRCSASKRCYRRWLDTGRGQKSLENPSRGRGWPLKAPPPCPGGLTLPKGCHMQKGGSVFVDVWHISKSSYFF